VTLQFMVETTLRNRGATLQVGDGQTNAVIPAHGFVVLQNMS
jgi:hypothetical protein